MQLWEVPELDDEGTRVTKLRVKGVYAQVLDKEHAEEVHQ